MSPPHNNLADINVDASVISNPPETVMPDIRLSPVIAVNKNLDNLLEKHGIKDCCVALERLADNHVLKRNESQNDEPGISPILLKRLRRKTPDSNGKSDQSAKSPILQKILIKTPPKDKDKNNGSQVETSTEINQNATPETSKNIKKEIETNLPNPPMISIPNDIVFPLLQKSNEVLLSSDSTMRKLRPWLKSSSHQKQLHFCDKMLKNEHCLASLFKCMASACDYYTNNSFLFHEHVRLHWENQKEDAKNFCQCPYCDFKNENSYLEYINHIIDNHGSTR
jgi:hypothetical protein